MLFPLSYRRLRLSAALLAEPVYHRKYSPTSNVPKILWDTIWTVRGHRSAKWRLPFLRRKDVIGVDGGIRTLDLQGHNLAP